MVEGYIPQMPNFILESSTCNDFVGIQQLVHTGCLVLANSHVSYILNTYEDQA